MPHAEFRERLDDCIAANRLPAALAGGVVHASRAYSSFG
jgi:hypothetical protein